MTNARHQAEQRSTWRSITAFLAACTLMLTMLGLTQPSFSVDGANADAVGMGECTAGSGAVMHNLTDGDISIEVIDQREGAENEETIKTDAIVKKVSQRWSGEGYGQRFGISNTTANDDRTFRIYFEFANAKQGETELPYLVAGDSKTKLEVGETYYQQREAQKNKYTLKKADGDGLVYYIEVPAAQVGETFALDVQAVYPAQSAGGTLKSWVEELTSEQLKARGAKASAPECGVHQATWGVDRTEYNAKKVLLDSTQAANGTTKETWGDTTDPSLAYDAKSGRYYIHNLRYLIHNERDDATLAGNVDEKGAWKGDVGEDPAVEMVYKDTFTVPEGFEINPDIVKKLGQNLSGGQYSNGTGFNWFTTKYPGQSNGYAYFNTLVAGGTPVLTVYNPGDHNENGKFRYEFSKDFRTITITMPHAPTTPTTRVDGPAFRVKFADNVLVKSGDQAPDSSFKAEIANHLDVTTKYRHSAERATKADAPATIRAKGVEPKVSKSHDSKKQYFRGDPIDFTITAENQGTAPWKVNEGREDEGKIIDALPKAFHVTPAQMLAMFAADGGDALTIDIKNVEVCTATVEGRTGTSGGSVTPSAQTSEDCVGSQSHNFTVKKKADGTLTVKRDGAAATSVQATEAALSKALGTLIVTPKTTYTLTWALPNGTINGGEKIQRVVKATVKDHFMAGDLTAEDATNTVHLGEDVPDVAKIENAIELSKHAFVHGSEVTSNGTEIPAGTVVDYSLTLERKGGQATYDSVPLIDDLTGAQVLLAEVDLNKALAGRGLPTMEVEGTQYYVLSKPGTYKGVRFRAEEKAGGRTTEKIFVADRVKITDLGDKGIQTNTYWYIASQDFQNPSVVTVRYKAVTDPKVAGYKNAGAKRDDVINVGRGDHRKLKAGDSKTFNISKLGSDKRIVTDKRNVNNLSDDATVQQSKISDGETVTYRVSLSQFGEQPYTVTGKDIYDALPKSLKGSPWSKANVKIEFPTQNSVKVEQGSLKSWSITNTNPVDQKADDTQQYIVWGEDLKLSVTGNVYWYVTLTFPAGDQWQEYVGAYSSETLYNTWYVKDAKSQVSHYLEGGLQATLQKGVSSTGSYGTAKPWTSICKVSPSGGTSCSGSSNPKDKVLQVDGSEDGRTGYEDQSGFVMYYAVLHNDGASRIYLNDIEDVLPEGFTFGGSDATKSYVSGSSHNLVFPTEQDRMNSWNWVADASKVPVSVSGSPSKPKIGTVHASTDPSNPRKVTFQIDNSGEGSNLSYDKAKQKYYLNAGETLGFRYFALVDDKSKLTNVATNWVGMPHDGGTANPMSVNPDVTITSNAFKKNPLNDGTRDVVDGAGAAKLGMNGKDGQQWLVSTVDVQRKLFVPGVTKQVTAKSALGKRVDGPEYAGYEDTLEWTVTGHNDSPVPISDYVMSDVLDEHYEFTGPVKFHTEDANGKKSTGSYDTTLFTFGKWSTDSNGKKSVKITYTAPYFNEVTTTLTVDGAAQVLKYPANFLHPQIYVSLSSVPEGGGVRLDVRAPVDSEGVRPPGGGNAFSGMPLEPGGKAVLVVNGKRKASAKQDYRVAFNTGYLTPLSKGWDPRAVEHGSVTKQTVKAAENYLDYNNFGRPKSSPKTYQDQPSVQSVAQIPIADDLFTTSIERVVEVADADNDATSVSSPNYITLPSKDSVFRYEMNVTNKKSDSINKMVLINNLPQVDDRYTFATAPERLSEFKTAFADQLNLKVELVDKDGNVLRAIDPSKYSIDFSKKTDFTDEDWAGSTASGAWLAQPDAMNQTRSMRISLADDAGVIPGNGTLRVSFDSKIPDDADAKPGEIAWNTFGYRYLAPGSSTLTLSSIPLKVGVRIPPAPTLAKALVDEKGAPRTAAGDSTYQFLVYSGQALTPAQLEGKSLAQALADEKRQVALVERTVAKGETASKALPISPGKTYQYDAKAKAWKPTDTTWQWEEGAQYTLVEIAASDGSELARIEQAVPERKPRVTGNHTTFTYRKAENPEFTAVNRNGQWAASIRKLDGGNCTTDTECAPLEGATFGLLTPNKAESDKVKATLPESFKNQIIKDGETRYYPLKVVTTDRNGKADLTGLKEDSYWVMELSAPAGYTKSDDFRKISKPEAGAAAPVVTVKNFPNYELPDSGGDGFRPGYVLAGLLIAGALGGLYWRRRSVR